jgi:hypothetical protein
LCAEDADHQFGDRRDERRSSSNWDSIMNAIPTVYDGIQFRSRLEARWACMFDMMSLNWLYEPLDLDGWIPDFVITNHIHKNELIDGSNGASIFVEIKPIDSFPFDTAKKIETAMAAYEKEKYLEYKSGPDHTAIDCDFDDYLGMYGHPLVILGYTIPIFDSSIGYVNQGCDWKHLFVDRYDDDEFQFSDEGYSAAIDEIMEMWKKAGNMVQWRGPQSVTD